MAEVRFYHLGRQPLEDALPRLLEKCLDRGLRAIVLAGSPQRVSHLNQLLWSWSRDGFLPHGAKEDGFAAEQPLWLTEEPGDVPNGATVAFQLDGMEVAGSDHWTLICDMFDGRDDEALAAARGRWRRYKDGGHEMTYWQQAEEGGWVRKA